MIFYLASIFKISFIGSFISADLKGLRRIFDILRDRDKKYLIYFLLIQVLLAQVFNSSSEVLMTFRVILVILTGYSISREKELNYTYLVIGLIFSFFLFYGSEFVYFTSIKSWISVAPLLLFGVKWIPQKISFVILVFLAIFLSSRTLLLGTAVYSVVKILEASKQHLVSVVVSLFSIIFFSAYLYDNLVLDQSYSNSVRAILISEAFSPDLSLSLLFGNGFENYRASVDKEVFMEMGVYSRNINILNPHFIFADFAISWGIVGLITFLVLFFRTLNKKKLPALGLAIVAGSLFTTNTGVERLFLSIGLGLLWKK